MPLIYFDNSLNTSHFYRYDVDRIMIENKVTHDSPVILFFKFYQVQVFDPISDRTIRRNPGPDVHRRGVKYLFKRPDLTYIYMKCAKRVIVEDMVFEVPERMTAEEFSNQLQVFFLGGRGRREKGRVFWINTLLDSA